MKTFVKFCGLTSAEALAEVPAGGAAGFVVDVPTSTRNLPLDRAAELVALVPSEAEAWGVVISPSVELIHHLFEDVGVDRIQVYGDVPEGLDFLEIHHLVPSVPVGVAGSGAPDPVTPPAESYPRVHLDASGGPLPGGSGVRPDWEVCARLVDANPGRKFILAGGLTPQNVAEALATVRPWGVDISSGIEREPGVKDIGKMRALVQAVVEFEATHA
ncbi:MAG: phosphoribosylanthranilate isomerase [Thermoplasmata archaeon]|nr:phosphoribosylanthranilate isomerase [Thermoplasmata archaeon]